MLSKQETYNKVAAHLLGMKRRAMNGGSCAYRTLEGERCAVGCLIPDEMYDPSMENQGVDWLIRSAEQFGYDLPGEIIKYEELLEDLQGVHDNRNHWDEDGLNEHGLDRLYRVAERHELEPFKGEV